MEIIKPAIFSEKFGAAQQDQPAGYNDIPIAIYSCDKFGYVTSFNSAAVKLWGRTPEAGKDLWCGSWKIYHPDGAPLPLDTCPMAIALKQGIAVEGEEIVIERP